MLSTVLCLSFAVLPQGSQADRPQGLTVVVVDVGQGDGAIIRAPDGTIHCIDAGPGGQGSTSMSPAINALQPLGYGFTFLSHYHNDHQGGLDELLNTRPFVFAYDRGDLRRTNTSSQMTGYLNAAGSRRRTVAVGTTYQLGGGATLRCIAVDGHVEGGGFVDPISSAQEENSRSIALRLDYGLFSMWFGGDLTGGGNSTADVESLASLACGDVDVYHVNHHGSNTSSNTNLITRLDPELAVVSCGSGNPYGHPTTTITNRINQAVASRALLSTTTGSSSIVGFGVAGDIRIDTDGKRYRATAENGDFLDFYCDEVPTPTLSAGDVRISEIHRNPSIVPDTNGEYVEVVNIGSRPVGLIGLQLADNASTVTLASNFMLVPGRPMVFQRDGAPSRNGGQPLGGVLPYNTLSLSNNSDSVTLSRSGLVLETMSYSSSWPGGAGTASERRDLAGSQASSNYAAAVSTFGSGDRGSPGRMNDADITTHPVQIAVESDASGFTLHGAALDEGQNWSVLGIAYGSSPGFPFLSVTIPLNLDPLLQAFLGIPGTFGPLPAEGYRSLFVELPAPSALSGVTLYAAHVVLDLNSVTVAGVSPALAFVLP